MLSLYYISRMGWRKVIDNYSIELSGKKGGGIFAKLLNVSLFNWCSSDTAQYWNRLYGICMTVTANCSLNHGLCISCMQLSRCLQLTACIVMGRICTMFSCSLTDATMHLNNIENKSMWCNGVLRGDTNECWHAKYFKEESIIETSGDL